MNRSDWGWIVSVLLWGMFGFWTGEAAARDDEVGVWIGASLTFLFPIGVVIYRLIKDPDDRRGSARRAEKVARATEDDE